MRDQPLRRMVDRPIGFAGPLGQRRDMALERRRLRARVRSGTAQALRHRPRTGFGARQIFQQYADVVARVFGRAVERRAMLGQQGCARAELTRCRAQAVGRLVAQGHQVARHRAQGVVAFVDPRPQHPEQPFQ